MTNKSKGLNFPILILAGIIILVELYWTIDNLVSFIHYPSFNNFVYVFGELLYIAGIFFLVFWKTVTRSKIFSILGSSLLILSFVLFFTHLLFFRNTPFMDLYTILQITTYIIRILAAGGLLLFSCLYPKCQKCMCIPFFAFVPVHLYFMINQILSFISYNYYYYRTFTFLLSPICNAFLVALYVLMAVHCLIGTPAFTEKQDPAQDSHAQLNGYLEYLTQQLVSGQISDSEYSEKRLAALKHFAQQ